MKSSFYFLCSLSLLLLGSCQSQESPAGLTQQEKVVEAISPLLDSSAIQYLLFCKEGKIEVWTDGKTKKPRFLELLQLKESIDFPIGSYPLKKFDQDWGLEFPNVFYQSKLGKKTLKRELFFQNWQQKHPPLQKWLAQSKQSKVLVLPNDIRKDQSWDACFACPHWMAELYGMLKIEMEQFSRS